MPKILEKPLHPDLIFNARSFDAETLWASKDVRTDVTKSSQYDLNKLLASKGIPAALWQGVMIDKPDTAATYFSAAIIEGLNPVRGPEASTLGESASRLASLLLLDDDFIEWVNAGPEHHIAQPRTYLVADDNRPLLI